MEDCCMYLIHNGETMFADKRDVELSDVVIN